MPNDEVNFTVSGAQWRNDTGATKARHQTIKRQKNFTIKIDGEPETNLHDVLNAKPTPRRGSTEGLLTYLRYMAKYGQAIMDFRLKPKTKRSRFDCYMHQQAAMDRLCRRVTRGHPPDKVCVFLGAAKCTRGFGYGPSPTKRFRHHLANYARVVVIHEHYTSQRCSVCAFEPDKIELPPEQHVQMRPGYDRQDGYKETVHGVRWCPECEITHHRDVNSARNMRKLGIHICVNRSRAPPFRHEGALND